MIKTSGARNRRTILMGKWGITDEAETQNGIEGGLTMNEAENRNALSTNGGGLTGMTGEGGVFSNAEAQFGKKSQFNKEKWLPLVYTPFPISHYCCMVMKKRPLKAYQKEHHALPVLGTMAVESRIRRQGWIRTGCNAFDGAHSKSMPMSFWTEQDVLAYIAKYNVEIPSVYGDVVQSNTVIPESGTKPVYETTGASRTGCVYCLYGAHLEKGKGRLERLAELAPKQYEFAMRGGQWIDNPAYDPVAPEYDGIWKNWNPKKIWVPGNGGLGLKYVCDTFNELYPNNKIKY